MTPGLPDAAPVFRFAPSPNGRLHLGHALSALTNQRLARSMGGRLLLRIEDIDLSRCRPEFDQAIGEDLAWLGLRFDGELRRQSQHFADYAAALQNLVDQGLAYPCFCSRQAIRRAVAQREAERGAAWPVDPDGAPLYPGTCRCLGEQDRLDRMAAGAPFQWRLDMARACARARSLQPAPLSYRMFATAGALDPVPVDPERWGDVVLARKDTPTSYHLSVVVDDALQGVTHVVRGRDLEAATEIHVLLQRLLGLPTPLYHFHPLLTDASGQKLAKSRGSRSLASLRAEGVTAEALRRQLGFG